MEIDEDILIIQDNKPNEPIEDPLKVNQCSSFNPIGYSGRNGAENIIDLDSSDDETSVISQRSQEPPPKLIQIDQTQTRNFSRETGSANKLLRTCLLQKLNKSPLDTDIIDLDREDSDPFAPLRSLINPSENKSYSNYAATKLFVNNIGKAIPIVKSKTGTQQTLGKVSIDQGPVTPSQLKAIKTNFKSPQKTLSKITERKAARKVTCPKINKSKTVMKSNTNNKLVDKSLPNNMSNELLTNVVKSLESSGNRLKIVSCKTSTSTSELTNQSHSLSDADKALENKESKNQKLTYLGKIIRIPGQPSLIENSSGFIFMTDNDSFSGLDTVGNNSETELNLYKNLVQSSNNISNTAPGQHLSKNLPNHSQNIVVNDLFFQKVNTNVHRTIAKVSDSNTTDKISDLWKKTTKQVKPVIIPYQSPESNNTILDLNLNINDRGSSSTTNSTNTLSSSPTTVPNDSMGRYNLELGLVLNVNDTNQQNSARQINPQNQFTSLNNVALDVSWNVNNKEKPATITSQHIPHNTWSSISVEPHISQDALNDYTSNTARQTYCCCRCSFKTFDVNLVKSHLCPLSSVANSVYNLKKPMQNINKSKGNQMRTVSNSSYKPKSDLYCNLCSFQTVNFELMKLHENTHTTKNSVINLDPPCKTLDYNVDNFPINSEYCCVACSFKTADIKSMSGHVCPSTLMNQVNMNSKKTNLESNESSAQNPVPKIGNYQQRKVQTIYNCVACSFQTVDLEAMNFHNCLLEDKLETENMTLVKESVKAKPKSSVLKAVAESPTEKLYYCISCSFSTTVFELANSHRCRSCGKDNNVSHSVEQNEKKPNNQQIAETTDVPNSIDKCLKKNLPVCAICRIVFATKYRLFHHLRHFHFGICTLFQCFFCTSCFATIKELDEHLTVIHAAPSQTVGAMMASKIYECSNCAYQTKSLNEVKIHFDKHIETYQSIVKMSLRPDQQEVLHDSSKTDYYSSYDCKLCGKKACRISAWFTHVCKEQKGNSTNSTQVSKRTYKRKSNNLLCICFYCKRQIIREAVKCDNSECEHMYHLECVDFYGKLMDPEELNNLHHWFCLDCNTEMFPIQSNINTISWCLDFADKEFLLELEKQKSMASELKKIKQENLRLKEEFGRIKKFIMESKSEKINNDVVKCVCTIVESFINAGIDSNS